MAVRASRLFLVVTAFLLVPLGMSVDLACCAGMGSMHSMGMDDSGCGEEMSCCDKAHDDALARHCCEGGERMDRSHSVPQVSAAPPVVLPAVLTVSEQALVGVLWSPLPPPKPRDLVTLHSAFLI